MVFPWMFEDLAALRPLRAVAHAVAEADSWSKLYDAAVLAETRVPVAAATYCEVRCTATVSIRGTTVRMAARCR